MLQSVDHTISLCFSGEKDTVHRRCECTQFRKGIVDHNASHTAQFEHGAVIAGIAGDSRFVQVDAELMAEPAYGGTLVCCSRQDIEVATAGIDDAGVNACSCQCGFDVTQCLFICIV